MCSQWFSLFNFLLVISVPLLVLSPLITKKQYYKAAIVVVLASIISVISHQWFCTYSFLYSVIYGFVIACSELAISAFVIWMQRREK
jgi:peptidoglycan/LPS O-acetylase OafA/YrhL